MDAKNLDAIQAKLQQAQEEKQKHTGQEVTTLQQEENVSISGSNARLMIMKKLSRKSEVNQPTFFYPIKTKILYVCLKNCCVSNQNITLSLKIL